MENPEISELVDNKLFFQPSEFNEENDIYDENEDDYDFNVEDSYDDGIAGSTHDSWEEDGFEDETDESVSEADQSEAQSEDSLQETEDYDALDD